MSTKEQSPMTEKESVRWRVANAHIDPDNYVFIPAKKQADYYDNDIPQRVAIYVRVSTDSSKQTMSYELQKKYQNYRGYDEEVTGGAILTILAGAKKYSNYNLKPVKKMIERQIDW